jgi:hypothetical protein
MSATHVMAARPDRSRTWRLVLWLSIVLMLLGSITGIMVPAGTGWDFANFYDAGHRVAAGQTLDLYDPSLPIAGAPPQGAMRFWGTPISAFFYAPLSWFPAGTALVLFKIENVLALAASFALLFVFYRRFVAESADARIRFAATFAFLCLIYQPFWTIFRVGGQTTPTVLLLVTVAMICHTRRLDWGSAICVVLAAMIKPALAPALACLVCLSGIPFAIKTIVTLAAAGIASLVLMGWPIHAAFLDLMRRGVQFTFPWYYNSSLFVLVEALQTAIGGGTPESAGASGIILSLVLKAVVLGTVVFLVMQSRGRPWLPAARRHYAVVVSLLFFLWWSPTLWEHYLAILFIPLAYVVASADRFSRSALALVAAIFVLSLAQNLILIDWLRRHVSFDSPLALVAIGLLKTGPLLLMLVFVWRHHRELVASYEAPGWALADDRSRA